LSGTACGVDIEAFSTVNLAAVGVQPILPLDEWRENPPPISDFHSDANPAPVEPGNKAGQVPLQWLMPNLIPIGGVKHAVDNSLHQALIAMSTFLGCN